MTLYPIVFEREATGAMSAYVVGLPVYAQARTKAQAARAIRSTLRAYLAANPEAPTATGASVEVARVDRAGITLVSAAALVGQRTSVRKSAAARANGRLGGRPRKSHAA